MTGTTPMRSVEMARRLYREAPLMRRLVLRMRPRICPFEELMSHVPQGSSVLDIGCGSGLFLGLLASTRSGFRGHGTDASRSEIQIARLMASIVRADGSDARLGFSIGDGADRLPEENFDVVSLIDVAHHLPPGAVAAVLRAAASRVAPDGGLLIYKDMASRPRWEARANRLHDLVLARQRISYVPVQLAEEVLGECGLRLVHAGTLNLYWYRHELRVFRRT
ncbi:MAG: class I SAM-dependent methyltransferase [Bryobacteraceae bacterium]